MKIELIAEAIEGHFGERCPDYDADCVCCKAWSDYDKLATRATPSPVPELVRYDVKITFPESNGFNEMRRMQKSKVGKYVRHDQAAAMITAEKQAAIDARNLLQYEKDQQWQERAEAAEIELTDLMGDTTKALTVADRAYISAHLSWELEPVGKRPSWNQLAMEIIRQDNKVKYLEAKLAQINDQKPIGSLMGGEFCDGLMNGDTLVYTAPVASEAETIERLRAALKALPDDAGDAAYQFCRFYIGSEHEDAISTAVTFRVQRAVDHALSGEPS